MSKSALTFYGYTKCSTCRAAMKWFDGRDIAYRFVDITQTPPPRAVLGRALKGGYTLRQLFNTSGQLYRAMGVKDRLADMSQAQALELLAGHGKLCKRPLVTDGTRVTVGFDAAAMQRCWG
jgi:arsenate reductase (glutaredoxin)